MIARSATRQRPAFRARLGRLNMAARVQLATVDGLADEPLPDLELMQQFGFTSTPPDGTQAVVIPLGGRTSASVIIATEHAQHRLVLNDRGEAAIYAQGGTWVHVKLDGEVHVKASTRVLIDSALTETTGDLRVGGNIEAVGDITDQVDADGVSMAAGRAIYNGHNHDENDSGGPTDQPNQQM
jgi:phage baseplate assembly protein V